MAAVRRRADELSPRLINVITSHGVRQWPVYVLEEAIRAASSLYWDYAEHYQLTIELGSRKIRVDVRDVVASSVVRPYVDSHGGRRGEPAARGFGSVYCAESRRKHIPHSHRIGPDPVTADDLAEVTEFEDDPVPTGR